MLPLQLLLSSAFATSAEPTYQLRLTFGLAGVVQLLGRRLFSSFIFSSFSLSTISRSSSQNGQSFRGIPIPYLPPKRRIFCLVSYSPLAYTLPLLLRPKGVHLSLPWFNCESCRKDLLVEQIHSGPFLRESVATKPASWPNGVVIDDITSPSPARSASSATRICHSCAVKNSVLLNDRYRFKNKERWIELSLVCLMLPKGGNTDGTGQPEGDSRRRHTAISRYIIARRVDSFLERSS